MLFAGTCERTVGNLVIVWGAVLHGERYSVDIHWYRNVVPHTEYFILFCIFHFNFELPQNKQEGQITYHSHSNSKVVGTAENCC